MMKKPNPKYRFSWRGGNRFRLLVDGGSFYVAMLDGIAAARHYVLLEMYLFESGKVADRFIDAFTKAAARGVSVYLLLDDFGAFRFNQKDRLRLAENGIRLAFYNPLHYSRWHHNLFRNHRKLLVIDGNVAYTGGAGIADQFDPVLQPQLHWHEAMVETRGSNVHDWQELFMETWNRWASELLQLPGLSNESTHVGKQAGRVVVQSRAVTKSEIMRSFVNHIRNAQDRVWLASAYFVPPRKLRRALRRSAKKGTDVRLLLPGPRIDHPGVRFMAWRYYEKMLRDGVRIFEYQPRFLHAKIFLCDNWVSIGSSNMDRWNYRWNLEANQEFEDPEAAGQVRNFFENDFLHCQEFHHETWRFRSRHLRLQEWFWGKIVNLLAWFSDKKNNPPGSDISL
jgi:phosphatidylserine/phosphatidylglycerophosphate/cardiolipin synthase-like enzyme